MPLRRRFRASHPLQEVVIFLRHDDLESIQLRLAQVGNLGLGELAQHQIHLANSPMPATIKNAAPAGVEIGTCAAKPSHLNHPLLWLRLYTP